MSLGRMRLWKDELDSLPEYSTSVPTGVCSNKCWKRHLGKGEWRIGCCLWLTYGKYRCFRIVWFEVDLLHGPRRGDEKTRLKTRCTREETLGYA